MDNPNGDMESQNTQSLTEQATSPPIYVQYEVNRENTVKKRKSQSWKCILGITIAAILGVLGAITIVVMIANRKTNNNSNTPRDDAQGEINKSWLKLRLPNGNFEECCSTQEKKNLFLVACNDVFREENIRCVNTTEGSIVIGLEGKNVDDIKTSATRAISKVDYIAGQSVTAWHHVQDEQNPINPGRNNNPGNEESASERRAREERERVHNENVQREIERLQAERVQQREIERLQRETRAREREEIERLQSETRARRREEIERLQRETEAREREETEARERETQIRVIQLEDSSENRWGCTMNLDLPWSQWRIYHVEPGYQGEEKGIKAGMRLLSLKLESGRILTLDEDTQDEIKRILINGNACTLEFADIDRQFEEQFEELIQHIKAIWDMAKDRLLQDNELIPIWNIWENYSLDYLRERKTKELFPSRNSSEVKSFNDKLLEISKTLKEELQKEMEERERKINNGQELNECPICTVEMNENESYKTPCCGNCIHEHCINHWTGLGNTKCPLCRGNL